MVRDEDVSGDALDARAAHDPPVDRRERREARAERGAPRRHGAGRVGAVLVVELVNLWCQGAMPPVGTAWRGARRPVAIGR